MESLNAYYLMALLALGLFPAHARAEEMHIIPTGQIEIQLAKALTGGSLQVLLFDNAEGFEDFKYPVKAKRFPADGRQVLQIPDVPAGEYALLVFHDENDNQQLDVNFIGIPREPVGFSGAYRPRGAPTFRNARFIFMPEESEPVQMDLVRPLGNRGRIGAGVVVITRGSPYPDATDNPFNILPAIMYIGNRLQITGPFAQIGITGTGRRRLAATLAYRQATYKQGDSPVLADMRNRRATAMAGVRVTTDTIAGIDLSFGYQLDALNRIGGEEASLALARPIPWNRFRFTPSIRLNYISPRLTRHDYGVSTAEAAIDRPAYRPGTALNPEIGLSIFAEITPNITGAVISSSEWFDSSIRRSPIVEENYVIKGTAFVVYMF
ncbi:MAG: MipA/OmpV family protein [Kiritimatiellia bacterium]